MTTLKDIVWPVVALGGIGALIDFLIGRAGQDKARDLLLRWWINFDDVKWRDVGKKEAQFAVSILDRLRSAAFRPLAHLRRRAAELPARSSRRRDCSACSRRAPAR